MEKAFERVWHDGLLFKLIKMYNICQNHIGNRSCQIGSSESKLETTSQRLGDVGVPHGSCLSTLLTPFVTTSLFADDTMHYSNNKNKKLSILRQCQINIITEWINKLRLRINAAKTVAVLFGTQVEKNLKQKLETKTSSGLRRPQYILM